ncbi:MAG: MBL fold metallo-hydrolase [Pseudomonadota bacterium]
MLRMISALVLMFTALAVQAAATVDDYKMQAEKVADGVYAIVSPAQDFPNEENKGWNSNSAFVVTDEGLLVFDTGSSETIGKALLQTIRRVSDAPIKWVINSHSHGDHWLGNGAFSGENPEEVIASDVAIEMMKEGGHDWIARFANMSGGATGEFEPVPATDAVVEAMEREFGGVKVQILFADNSHSPGDIVFWLPQKKVLLTGDTMYTQRPPATFDSNVQGWITFLERASRLDAKVVVPGHGPVAGAESITQLQDYFETLWNLVAEGYEAGKMDYEIAEDVKEKMARFEEPYPGLYDRLGESISHVYLQVEEAMF